MRSRPVPPASLSLTTALRESFADEGSRKLALFSVTNVLFKIYFKLNTLQLCSKLINVVERPGPSCATDAFRYFPVADVVAYKYYVGRLKMFEDRYEEARDCFLFTLKHTPSSRIANIRRILINLVPVQVSLSLHSRTERTNRGCLCCSSCADVSRHFPRQRHR